MADVIFPPNDFLAYWSGFQLLLQGGDPYNYDQLSQYQKSLGYPNGPGPIYYSPILFFILAPILWLPLSIALGIWGVLNIALILGCVVASAKMSNLDLKPIEAATIGVLFPACVLILYFSQVSALVCFSFLSSVYLLTRARPTLAGIALLPALLKPHLFFLALIPMALQAGRLNIRFILGLSGGIATMLLTLHWLRPGLIASHLGADSNALEWLGHSPISALRLLVGLEHSSPLILAPAAVAAVVVLICALYKRIELTRDVPLLLCLSALLTPYIWIFDFIILLPAVLRIYSTGRLGKQLLLLLAAAWWSYGVFFGFTWRSFIFSVAITLLLLLLPRMTTQEVSPQSV